MWKRLMVAVIATSAAGCAVEVPVEPVADAAVMKQGAAGIAGAPRLNVMTRNLYLGSALASALAQAPLDRLPIATAQITKAVSRRHSVHVPDSAGTCCTGSPSR